MVSLKGAPVLFCCGAVSGGAVVFAVMCLVAATQSPTNEELIAQYYASEVATLVSPHSIRERLDHHDTSLLLVDVRAAEDYERAHIATAINIDTSRPLEEVSAAFAALPSGKQVVIYCYSASCMNGRKAGSFLAQQGIYVQEMTIGWNEWRYDFTGWNYDNEWDEISVTDYIATGTEPGSFPVQRGGPAPCPVGGSLGC